MSLRSMFSRPAWSCPETQASVSSSRCQPTRSETLSLCRFEPAWRSRKARPSYRSHRHSHECIGVLGQHQLADEEVAKVDEGIQVGVRMLLHRKNDVATDTSPLHIFGAAVGSFHDPRSAPGHDRKAGFGQFCADFSGLDVVRMVLWKSSGPKIVTHGPTKWRWRKPRINSRKILKARRSSPNRLCGPSRNRRSSVSEGVVRGLDGTWFRRKSWWSTCSGVDSMAETLVGYFGRREPKSKTHRSISANPKTTGKLYSDSTRRATAGFEWCESWILRDGRDNRGFLAERRHLGEQIRESRFSSRFCQFQRFVGTFSWPFTFDFFPNSWECDQTCPRPGDE